MLRLFKISADSISREANPYFFLPLYTKRIEKQSASDMQGDSYVENIIEYTEQKLKRGSFTFAKRLFLYSISV